MAPRIGRNQDVPEPTKINNFHWDSQWDLPGIFLEPPPYIRRTYYTDHTPYMLRT